ncbi:aromatic amino acid DMT transporter YddG [Candidatus Pantoea multigeneris]|uniref:Drug/metabolite DMT transporter permease n=1 Tax=Candidatus Pantoea multigeneris TaxID=2608357 RepID=A0ABX0RE60_9GAMM|nr:aromatic amino acid DMT transporter YddG [Pantoea multigeneris]NIF23646.1 drug/metabolite DMT transporter permease [Pantoea multigeneris]
MTNRKATLIGLMAVLLWSAIVGLIRSVSEGFGPIGGAAMIYTCSAILLLFTVGFPRLREFPRAYVIWGSLLFVSYELCLSLSLGFANSAQQAIEVGMVNYLWPSMTILFSVVFNKQRASLLIIPGMLLAIAGIGQVLGGSHGLSLHEIGLNLQSNPLSYGLAFAGAIIWSVYCIVTKRIANGKNGVTLFFILTALTLWIKFSFSHQPDFIINTHVVISLLLAAMAMAFGYAAWNVGILHGNVTVLASASYFIPVISSVIAATILQSGLSIQFWQGAALVCIGSLVCWWSTRTRSLSKVSQEAQ